MVLATVTGYAPDHQRQHDQHDQADWSGVAGLPPGPILADLLKRAADPRAYARWERQVRHARYCTHPVRLAGTIDQADLASGETRTTFDTSTEPDGIVLKACGTRRAARCEPCAQVYRADAYHLVAAGLAGSKGIPESIATHPRVFATLTAPSFGRVHTRRERGGAVFPCHAGRLGEHCPHGRRVGCRHKHPEGDPALGTPLCPECYDYQGAVIWNGLAPRLWRRTTIYLRRAVASLAGLTVRELSRQVRLSYVKVAEYQARGQIHYHAIIRLDGLGEAGELAAPPSWATVDLLTAAIKQAAKHARVPIPAATSAPAVAAGGGRAGPTTVTWGAQLDIRLVPLGLGEGSASHVASYLAKYATKATETLAGSTLDRPIRSAADLQQRALPDHARRLVEAAWQLGTQPELAGLRLRAWAHQLGYGGHCTTKSRRYSLTFAALRKARHEYQRRRAFGPDGPVDAWGRPEQQGAAVEVGAWSYEGRGYTTLADAWLARSLLENARQQRHIAREEWRAA